MMRKPGLASGYSPEQTERVEQVLIEVWSHLGAFHEHLVLVGGLAPRYLVTQDAPGIPPHCGTIDVDLAVSLAVADVKAYAGIRETLERLGFQPGVNSRGNEQRHSFVLPDPAGSVIVDFLTTAYDGPPEVVRAVERQLSAIQVEGLGLALRQPVSKQVIGKALRGGVVRTELRVCRPVPFLVLKALAFQKRRGRKDAHDLVYILRHVDGGPAGLARQVMEEERNAEAFVHAMNTLADDFESPQHDGPVRCGQFAPEQPDAAAQAFAAVREFLGALP